MIKLLEKIQEKFEENPENKNNASLLPLVVKDLENLKKQVNGGSEKFNEILKK